MKARVVPIPKPFLFSLFFFLITLFSYGQGRIVINEYMPWTANGCGATAEFVELMNFGPGPVNIGGYILTDGDYSITIPANTLVQPGEFFLISGQNVLPAPCANIDSTVHADLNWNTCGCTSSPIPATGEGFFTDGGSANEQVVLLDRNLNVVDAVVRSFPVETAASITTKDMGYGSKTFDLDLMTINYETLGMSTGRANSFARRLDGDCGWVKDPQQSGNATNNTPGDVSSVSYSLSIVNSMDCNNGGGRIVVHVTASNYTDIFPMNYVLAYDINRNNVFDTADLYTQGTDDSPNTIPVSGLLAGRYRITVSSALGCNLHTFDFTILACYSVLPVRLLSFSLSKTEQWLRHFECQLDGAENLESITLEKSTDNRFYTDAETVPTAKAESGRKRFDITTPEQPAYAFYRLRIEGKDGTVFFSPVINANGQIMHSANRVWPNPAKDKLQVELTTIKSGAVHYTVYNVLGTPVGNGTFTAAAGHNSLSIPVGKLPGGTYGVVFEAGSALSQPIPVRFVKQ